MNEPRAQKRLNVIRYLIIFAMLVLFLGFWYLQVIKGNYYSRLSENNRFVEKTLPAPRGFILDRNNNRLATNRLVYNLSIIRERMKNSKSETISKITPLLDIPESKLHKRFERFSELPPFKPIVVVEDIGFKTMAYIESHKKTFSEFLVTTDKSRVYPYKNSFAHILGYVGEITEQQLQMRKYKDFTRGDIVGQAGIEKYYDSHLQGKDGVSRIVVNNLGREIKVYNKTAPERGNTLKLTVNSKLQNYVTNLFKDKSGVALALNPHTGEIYFMYSAPSFNPNKFTKRFTGKEWNELVSRKKNPLQNRITRGLYSPGSLFKIVITLAGLEEGTIDSNTSHHCRGYDIIYGDKFFCWKKGGHGKVNLYEAIVNSCNVFFYNEGKKLGIENISKYARMLGLGSKTGIDLPGEKSGLIPDREWKQKTTDEPWYKGETISVSIGQGPIQVTPVQLLVMISAIANKGKLIEPHFLDSITSGKGKTLKTFRSDDQKDISIASSTIKRLKQGLFGVVNDRGTGRWAKVEGKKVCGKTGTAQIVSEDYKEKQKEDNKEEELKREYRDHSWFGCFAPKENPEIAMIVLVEHGGHGGESAAPLSKKILKRFFEENHD